MKVRVLSAGVVVVRRENGCRYLLLRCYNYWDFPRGIVEKGENSLAAALREVEEETGIAELNFYWGNQYRETEPYGSGKVARYYVALTSQRQVNLVINQELGRPEHDEYRWVTYQEGCGLVVDRIRAVLEWAHQTTGCGK